MSTAYAPSGVKVKVYPYEDFQGVDASRDKAALDTGQKQHLITIDNGFADWRGSIVRDAGASQRTSGDRLIKHINFYGRNKLVWAQKDGGGISLKSDQDHLAEEVFPKNNITTSTLFNDNVIFFSRDNNMYRYDGLRFRKIEASSDPRPAFGVAFKEG